MLVAARSESDQSKYLEIAAGLLGAFGPVDGGVKVQAAAVEEVVGVSRSTVYRLWPSMLELTEDLVLHAATGCRGWYHEILRRPPQAPIRESFAAAIRPESGEMATRFRGAVATWPRDSGTYRQVRSWEGEWLSAFTVWLGLALTAAGVAPCGGVSVEDLAVLVAGLVEGQILVDIINRSPGRALTPELNDDIAMSVELFLYAATVAADAGTAGTPGGVSDAVATAAMVVAPAAPTRTDQRRGEVLDALMEADAAATAHSTPVLAPTRLVDQTRLAHRLGLSDRRVRMFWPNGSAFNADLVGYLLDRTFDESERVIGDLVEAAVEEEPDVVEHRVGPARFGRYLDLVASMWDQLGRLGPGCGQGHALSAVLAVMDPEVARRAQGVLLAHRHEGQVLLLAVMQAFEIHFRPAVRPAVYLGPLYGARLGFERLTLTHPSLGSRRVDLADSDGSLFGFGYRSIYQGMACEAVNDGAAHDHSAMPHL